MRSGENPNILLTPDDDEHTQGTSGVGFAMNLGSDTLIAGSLTTLDWNARKNALANGTATWDDTFEEFFVQRLRLRYLEPIRVLQQTGALIGEGFSILAVQCSLIEFLESTVQGLNYRWVPRNQDLGPDEYCKSSSLFVSFLSKRAPFSTTFDATSALDFYANVRCGLLHEACTKGGWRVRARGPEVADIASRIVYRDNFQDALSRYIAWYGEELKVSQSLQRAFVRKFDRLTA
jgi:hypothetical protein